MTDTKPAKATKPRKKRPGFVITGPCTLGDVGDWLPVGEIPNPKPLLKLRTIERQDK